MPYPKVVGSTSVWDRVALDAAFEELPNTDAETPRHNKRGSNLSPHRCQNISPSEVASPNNLQAYSVMLNGSHLTHLAIRTSVDSESLRCLVERYYTSARFMVLDQRTQHVRKLILDRFCDENGYYPYTHLRPRDIRFFRDRTANRPEAANSLIKALRQVYDLAIADELMDDNPARKITYLKPKNKEGHHTWTLDEVRAYEERHPVGKMGRLALALLLYTGQRRSDIILLGKQHANNGVFHFTQQKNRNRAPVRLELPILPQLQAIIDRTSASGVTFLETAFHRPFTANGFGNKFRDWCDQEGLHHCSAHGLRKAGATHRGK